MTYFENITDYSNKLVMNVFSQMARNICHILDVVFSYGDIYPKSIQGRVIASIAATFGVVMIAMPVSIIVEAFSDSYAEITAEFKNKKKRRRHIRSTTGR